MPRTDPDFSERVQKALRIIRHLAVNFEGEEHDWLGVVLGGDLIEPEILAYLEDEATGVLTRKGMITSFYMITSAGEELAQYYRSVLKLATGMVVYEICISTADLTAMAAGNTEISRAVAGRA